MDRRDVRILCLLYSSPDNLRKHIFYDGCSVYDGSLIEGLTYLQLPSNNGYYIIQNYCDEYISKYKHVTEDGRCT